MGSGYSVDYSNQLICPSDCEQETFQQILRLYDRLDVNGDHAIENKELQAIANLHIDNEIKRIKRKIELSNDVYKQKLVYLRSQSSQEMARIRSRLESRLKQEEDDQKDRQVKMDDHAKTLKNLDSEDRARKFKREVSGCKTTIEFWDFFNYMKNKTDDIPNIVW